MSEQYVIYNLRDNGGRRSGIERRRFSYADHIPERRAQKDRRVLTERRSGEDRRSGVERRCSEERRIGWAFGERRSGSDRRDATIL
jgi:hypothetical protein